jgi:hypothetical protein
VSADEDHPVLYGLLALVGVAVAVGLVAGVAVMAGAHVLGLGGGHAAVAGDAGATLDLPRPQKTKASDGPSITLGTESTAGSSQSSNPTIHKPKKKISLQSAEITVSPMGRIDLTGTYPGGEGAVLNVQKFSNGAWGDFVGISASVTNGSFKTYVQTGTPGVNRFRMVDSDSTLTSNEVKVTVR